ncbi:MAG: YidC/Oxa1 family membrane protein insertase [Candidatus Merdivicinus sp.]|jgi:YidC/Oxa1 family membrane protein insertase
MNFINELFGIPLGWIMWLLYSVIRNYGIALILFTVLIKAALFPLSIKQQKSSAKMAVFQPKMLEIQKKYANNKQKQQEELMKFYEEHGYNPMSGCLPLFIQFPILFGIIDVVYNPLRHILRIPRDVISQMTEILSQHVQNFNTYQAELYIISAVQNPDQVSLFSSIDPQYIEKISNFDYSLFGLDLGIVPQIAWSWMLIIPILSGVTALLTSVISMRLNPQSAAQNQQSGCMMKGMMYGMPLFSLWITFSVPVGVGIYWIISNILATVQTIILNKLYNPARYKEEYEQQMREIEEKKRIEREKRRKRKLAKGEELDDDDLTEEELKEKKRKERQQRLEKLEKDNENRDPEAEYLTAKEINRKRLAEARKRDAEKYGEEYIEVTDKDLM